MSDIDVAVYLVHGIGEGADWVERETADALNFRVAAHEASVERIIYLGGMGDDASALSDHLASRHSVGRTLAAGQIPVCELRAAVVIGSGSASFEMLRHLVEVLPVMITPKWVSTRSQPIAISDVLDYLVKVIEAPRALSGVYEIGGPDIVSYAQMMEIYAKEAGLNRRWLIPVPVLSPRLSSHWVGVVTPVPASLARPLVDSLVNEVIVRDTKTIDELGAPKRSLREAITWRLAPRHVTTCPPPTPTPNCDRFVRTRPTPLGPAVPRSSTSERQLPAQRPRPSTPRSPRSGAPKGGIVANGSGARADSSTRSKVGRVYAAGAATRASSSLVTTLTFGGWTNSFLIDSSNSTLRCCSPAKRGWSGASNPQPRVRTSNNARASSLGACWVERIGTPLYRFTHSSFLACCPASSTPRNTVSRCHHPKPRRPSAYPPTRTASSFEASYRCLRWGASCRRLEVLGSAVDRSHSP